MGKVLDPCFAGEGNQAGGVDSACVDSPYDTAATVISAPTVPVQHVSTLSDPWWLVLVGGRRCGFLSGATDSVDGQRLNYSCADNVGLYGDPDTSTAVWTILGRLPGDTALRPLQIATVWDVPAPTSAQD